MEYVFALAGFAAGCLFVAYRLRGDRTVTEAVTEAVMFRPAPRSPK